MIETKFKDSTYGLIPHDWKECRFENVLQTFSSGATPCRGVPSNFQGTIRWITSGELNYNHIYDTIEHISEDALKNTHLRLHPKGTFLMAITGLEAAGTRGRCAFVGSPSATNQSCLAINSTDKMIVEYLFWFYCYWSDFLAFRFSQGSKQQSFTANIVRNLPIYLPPTLDEQQRIAEALSDVDALISSLGKMIEKKRNIKLATMQQLLTGKQRLPGFSEPWEEKKLGEVADIYRGGSPRPISSYITQDVNGINWIKIGDVSPKSKYITKTAEKIKPSGAKYSREVHAGDFILSNSMSFGRPYILALDGCIHDGWLVIMNYSETFDKEFLFYYLSSQHVMNQYIAMAAGSSVKNLNKEKVADVSMLIPTDMNEQKSIAKMLSDFDDEIDKLETEHKKYEAIKQGMMQQLLTGKIRLTNK